MIATIAVIAEKKKVQRSYGNHSPVIAATTIAEIVVAAIAGEWFHMIATNRWDRFLFSQRSQRSQKW